VVIRPVRLTAVAVDRPALVLLALSPMAMLLLFARERQQRLDAILELSTARGTTLLLGDIIEADDRYTGVHSREVVDLSLSVSDALGLDSTRRRNVEFSALLHDVGKIRVPKEILNKPGQLEPSEWALVRRHTIDGEAMLRQVGGTLARLGPIVRASHERWDGAGYPDGLAGEQIPIEARIISACDAYNAMTTDRPYRPAMEATEALRELKRGAASQFDPQVVDALHRRLQGELDAALDRPSAIGETAGSPPAATPRTPQRQLYTAVSARL
jgi:HD-GYP domain-containing protein (c-di-GMP phosphodiesterase class II)